MTPLVRFLIRHAAIGCAIAVAFVGVLVTFDIGGLRSLAGSSSSGPLAIVLLTVASALTFASVQMGFAIMLLGVNPRKDGGKRRPALSLALSVVRVARRK